MAFDANRIFNMYDSIDNAEDMSTPPQYENLPGEHAEGLSGNENNAEVLDNTNPRKPIRTTPSSIALAFKTHRYRCKEAYTALKNFGFFLPQYRSRCVTFNYLVGVCDGEYFGIRGDVPIYDSEVKVSAIAVYYELIKAADRPLGFNSTNLPAKSYLLSVLYHINRNHIFFQQNMVNVLFPEVEAGIFEVPVSCRGLIRVTKQRAEIATANAIRSGRKSVLRIISSTASLVADIEKIKYQLVKIKKKISKNPGFQEDTQWANLNNLLRKIK